MSPKGREAIKFVAVWILIALFCAAAWYGFVKPTTR